eukprot:7408212-Pyramimonas_sp.AAC.1
MDKIMKPDYVFEDFPGKEKRHYGDHPSKRNVGLAQSLTCIMQHMTCRLTILLSHRLRVTSLGPSADLCLSLNAPAVASAILPRLKLRSRRGSSLAALNRPTGSRLFCRWGYLMQAIGLGMELQGEERHMIDHINRKDVANEVTCPVLGNIPQPLYIATCGACSLSMPRVLRSGAGVVAAPVGAPRGSTNEQWLSTYQRQCLAATNNNYDDVGVIASTKRRGLKKVEPHVRTPPDPLLIPLWIRPLWH